MRVSKYIPKLAIHNIIKKKNRSLLSFVSVMLSSCIIFVSLILFSTVFTLSKSLNSDTLGSAHYYLVSSHLDITDPYLYQASFISMKDHSSISYMSFDEKATFLNLESGHFPSNEKEVIAFQGDYQVGDVIEGYVVSGVYLPSTFFQKHFQTKPIFSIDEQYKGEINHYFIHDTRIQDEGSIDSVASIAGVEVDDIYLNHDRISNDTITNYLQDTSTILAMFVVIVLISMIMCLVSIYNVLIVNDVDRRKEIGLLKSIGITAKELKWLLVLELAMIGFVGGIAGVFIGVFISSGVLYSVLDELKIVFDLHFVLRPIVIVVSILCGMAMMVISGYLLYRHYFTSTPISDLKGEPVEYDIPYDPQRFSINSVTWQMFIIYNERIKKQTRNLRRSFLLVMLTITLFCGIWFSNFLYQRNYQQVKADYLISQANFTLGNQTLYPELEERIYDLAVKKNTGLKKVNFNRMLIGVKLSAPMSSFSEHFYKTSNINFKPDESAEIKWSSDYHHGLVLDEMQLKELEPYVVAGDLSHLTKDSTILIYNQYGYFTSSNPVRTHQIGYPIKCENIDQSKPLPPQYFNVDVIIELPYKKNDLQYSTVDDYLYTIAFTEESFKNISNNNLTLRYEGVLEMENPSNHAKTTQAIKDSLFELGLSSDLILTDYLQVKSDGEFAVFLIEVLLYPLFLMLVMIGAININNVLKGNIHMKRTDFATMKSVGMTSYQLRMIMIYEYVENYLNAGAITFLMCIPVYLLEKYFSIASTFRVGDNFAGMYIMSFAMLSPVLIVSLALISFKHLKKITALDGLKDVT